MTESIRVVGLLSTSEGVLRRTAELYHRRCFASWGWGELGVAAVAVVVGGWVSLTDGLHRLLTGATLIHHT